MNNNSVKIFCTNKNAYFEVPMGTSLLEMTKLFDLDNATSFVNAKVNNKTESLSYQVFAPKTVQFVDLSQESGMRCYVRSLCFVLFRAVAIVHPNTRIMIEHSLSKGYYFTVGGDRSETIDIQQVKEKMHQLIAENIPFESIEAETDKVAALFREKGFEDKALLLESCDSVYSKYYVQEDYIDYFYGVLLPSTGYISLFDIIPLHAGFLLRIPSKKKLSQLEPLVDQPKMYQVFNEQKEFLRIIGLENVGELNKASREKRMPDIIKIAEALQEKMIAEYATHIKQRYDEGVRIVLIAGPSSSGKTTFRKRLEVQLMTNLLKPVGLSLDDYFVDREKTPLDDKGEFDFESLYALDVEQFNADLEALLAGKKVSIPTFNFTTGKRDYKGNELAIDDNSILIIEGIHGLNPELTSHIDASKKFMIYVSALTTISLDNHNWIPTTDNRLLRRMVRDYKYRNYSAVDTLSRWESVRQGEDKWIFPYQENADIMFNSAMIYELAAIRKYAEPILREVPKKSPEYAEAHRLLKFLSYFNFVDDKELPPTSLLREFLGGSSFKY